MVWYSTLYIKIRSETFVTVLLLRNTIQYHLLPNVYFANCWHSALLDSAESVFILAVFALKFVVLSN